MALLKVLIAIDISEIKGIFNQKMLSGNKKCEKLRKKVDFIIIKIYNSN